MGDGPVKYMGSKRMMLGNGLGDLLNREIPKAQRFVDMFLGTAEVASFVATRHTIPVYGVDLQAYSVILAEAIIGRSAALSWEDAWESWSARASELATRVECPELKGKNSLSRAFVEKCREWCAAQSHEMPITLAYGGHYFSPRQAVWIDAFRTTLPEQEPLRASALAALICAASLCVASPGHTAQPFQPTATARRFLEDAWLRDIRSRARSALRMLADQHCMTIGAARIADANETAEGLLEGDLVFLDPPYSGVQYSRFYHVLETIARGGCGQVSGVGRYPERALRPTSKYSLVSKSSSALDELLARVSSRGARGILTFPDHECSNGLSGDDVRDIARAHFSVTEQTVASKFSTLGGRGSGNKKVAKRKARHDSSELILLLSPR